GVTVRRRTASAWCRRIRQAESALVSLSPCAASAQRCRRASRPARFRSRIRASQAFAVSSSSYALVPCAAIALDQRNGSGWSPCAGCIALHGLMIFAPGSEDRIDPLPCRLDLVAAHEQRLVAANDIHDQAFI